VHLGSTRFLYNLRIRKGGGERESEHSHLLKAICHLNSSDIEDSSPRGLPRPLPISSQSLPSCSQEKTGPTASEVSRESGFIFHK
jgi:hypothetical protein